MSLLSSGRAVEAAGDVNVLLLDKTGTITLGTGRRLSFASRWQSLDGLMEACSAFLFRRTTTPEGKSIIALIQEKTGKTPVSPGKCNFHYHSRQLPDLVEHRLARLTYLERCIRFYNEFIS